MNKQTSESKNENEQPLVDLELSEAQSETAKGGDSSTAGTVTLTDFNFMKRCEKTT
jgi:hypothetical protein